MTAGVILAIMIIADHHLALARGDRDHAAGEKEAALALGATRWEMISGAVLPHTQGGLVGAVMLGLGRAMGETIAAALVIGSARADHRQRSSRPGDSMPAVIANEWGEARRTAQAGADRRWR